MALDDDSHGVLLSNVICFKYAANCFNIYDFALLPHFNYVTADLFFVTGSYSDLSIVSLL